MIKQGTRVEVRDNKSRKWSDNDGGDKYYYVADTSNIGDMEPEYRHIIIDGAGDIDKYRYCQPVNTKKAELQAILKTAKDKLKEANDEIDNAERELEKGGIRCEMN